ncbi:MAG: histidine phosphatase family protein [Patescibacteria group bacterium]|nr:histidine phosphatase family protein [Patescibacteria group bacterium]
MSIFIARHAQSLWNAASDDTKRDTARSLTDADVSDEGKKQLLALEQLKLPNVTRIFTSPLTRAIRTAQALSAATGAPIRACGFLREVRRDCSDLGGNGLAERFPGVSGLDLEPDWWLTPFSRRCDCRELFECNRCIAARVKLAKKLIRKNAAHGVVIVSHSDFIVRLCGWDAGNAEVARFSYVAGAGTVVDADISSVLTTTMSDNSASSRV